MTIKNLTPLHPEAWRFVPLFALAALLLFLIAPVLGWIGVVLTLWCAYFFRDPDRFTPLGTHLVIAPADGIVQAVLYAVPPAELGVGSQPLRRVSIFMDVFNVHVNRAPIDGEVAARSYRPGRFFNASLDKASEHNERLSLVIDHESGHRVIVTQIAGLIARRIRCDVAPEDRVRAGQRFGMIRFGSRVDVYLPDGVEPLVCVGQTMVAGETVLADLTGEESPREAEKR
ncbi:MAG TPA: phosphatidylserine decarboxylase [Dongiaceae bacterium]|jgi:phosphatidylserine decarboxylase|nr:phosphatidylserine decarboxylase [Dongiaceae bacterium]